MSGGIFENLSITDVPNELLIGITVVFLTYVLQQYIKSLTKAKKNAAVDAKASSGPRNKQYDFVVLGAGPGGVAAATRLSSEYKKNNNGKDAAILLLDQGVVAEGSNLALPSMSPYWLKSTIDGGEYGFGPFNKTVDDGKAADLEMQEKSGRMLSKAATIPAIPAKRKWIGRGSGAGGCTLMDHGIHFYPGNDVALTMGVSAEELTSVQETFFDPYDGKELTEGQKTRPIVKSGPVELRLNAFRSPLSWAFAESATVVDYEKCLPSDKEAYGKVEHKEGKAVFPFWLRSAENGQKKNFLYRQLLNEKNIDLVLGWTIVDVPKFNESTGAIESISVALSGSDSGSSAKNKKIISVQSGLVLACGTYGTPKVLRRWNEKTPILSSPSSSNGLSSTSYDFISLPLVYQTLPGLSNDPCNIHGAWNLMKAAWGRKTTLLNPVTDTAVSIKVPSAELGNRGDVTLMIQFVPSGGFSRELFKKLDRSESLGLFKEAMEFRICALLPVEARLATEKANWKGYNNKTSTSAALVDDSTESGRSAAEDNLQLAQDALVRGIELCREMVVNRPLNQLSTGKEVLDIALFPETLGSNQRARRQIFKVLYGKPPKHTNKAIKRDYADCANEARNFAISRAYLDEYVKAHAGFGGYACGSLASQGRESAKILTELSQKRHISIGDGSVIPPETLTSIGGGATNTLATIAGWRAADSILRNK